MDLAAERPHGAGDVGHRLQGADLVVDQHDRDDGGFRPHRRQHRFDRHAAVGAGRHFIELPSLLRQSARRVEDGRVLERADHDVAQARGAGGADQSQGIGLGAAAGEDHFRGLGVQQRRDLLASRGQRPGRARAQAVQGGGIGEVLAHGPGHGLDDFGQGLGGRGVVEVGGRQDTSITRGHRWENGDLLSLSHLRARPGSPSCVRSSTTRGDADRG